MKEERRKHFSIIIIVVPPPPGRLSTIIIQFRKLLFDSTAIKMHFIEKPKMNYYPFLHLLLPLPALTYTNAQHNLFAMSNLIYTYISYIEWCARSPAILSVTQQIPAIEI